MTERREYDCDTEMTHAKSVVSHLPLISPKGKVNKGLFYEGDISGKSCFIQELHYREGKRLLHGYDSCERVQLHILTKGKS